jgi:hypothetical protein
MELTVKNPETNKWQAMSTKNCSYFNVVSDYFSIFLDENSYREARDVVPLDILFYLIKNYIYKFFAFFRFNLFLYLEAEILTF